jgi:hypothetical protein
MPRMGTVRLANLDEALDELAKLERSARPRARAGWSLYKVLVHCRQSIDASVAGFPRLKPAVLRKTVGRLIGRRFLAKGVLSHDLEAVIPGAPAIDDDGDTAAALAELRASIHAFRAHEGALSPHFVFDVLDKRAYDQLHAMHIADHLGAIDYR